jgi:hypothetical protein
MNKNIEGTTVMNDLSGTGTTVVSAANGKQTPSLSTSDLFSASIANMQEQDKTYFNKRITSFIGYNAFTIEDLPVTMQIIDKTYENYMKSFKETGYIDFSQTGKITGVSKGEICKIFDKEIYGHLEKHFLNPSEIATLQKLVPESHNRQEMFVKYLRGQPINLQLKSNPGSLSFIKALFRKILQGFFKIMEHKNDLETLFEKIKSNNGISSCYKPTGTKIQGVKHVKDLDLRKSNLYSLGSLKKVSGDIHLDSDCKIPKQSWSKIDIQGRIFLNGKDKTELYKNITQRKPGDKSILFPGMER